MTWARLCVATALLFCWPLLSLQSDGMPGTPGATWERLDGIWTSLESENDRRSQRLEHLEKTSAMLVSSLRNSESESVSLRRELELLRIELRNSNDTSSLLSEALEASETALGRIDSELQASQTSLQMADESLRASESAAFWNSLLIGAAGIGAGVLVGLVVAGAF